ncbi:patatin-like phospholipase family protein [Xenorhabdus sp. KK7.4]|uniref:patatin-like phospholipase family protein n=1 Tax=Xenorhabdus sp. KK7.4 TaxID=1851572 RepID=UPI000C046DB2|nr:patatin-like phospholipase family protein [Xenorhabdus sp. KK7.4]PHM53862.1 putative sporulation hydrolase CotR [Xenorhabdus sp. KK7.4]
MTFKIICCDGGGIRGLLTARLIEDLDKKFQIIKRTNGFAGTSTGGLLALGMAHGVPISKIVDLYKKEGANIFIVHSLLQNKYKTGICDFPVPKLTQELDRQFQIQITKKTSRIAGISTEGISSQGMPQDITLSKMIGRYRNDGIQHFGSNEISLQNISRARGFSAQNDEPLGRPGLTGARYYSCGLKKILQELFSDAQLSSSGCFIAINAAQLWNENNQSWLPCTFSNLPENPFRNISMVDAAMATSAAPTYFPPYRIQVNSTDFGYFVDGGVFANNPSMTALTEALSLKGISGPTDIRMLSVGTGDMSNGVTSINFDNYAPLSWGIKSWLWPLRWGNKDEVPPAALLMLIFETTAKMAEFQAEKILGKNYLRANFTLSKPFDIDNWQDIETLEAEVDKYLQTPDWERICNQVKRLWI